MSKRQDIFDAVVARLGSVATVKPWRVSDLEVSELPALIVKDGEAPVDAGAEIGRFQHNLTISVECLDHGTTAETAVRSMMEDVLTAVGSDPTFGGLAHRTTITGTNLIVEHQKERVAAGVVGLIIRYRVGAFEI